MPSYSEEDLVVRSVLLPPPPTLGRPPLPTAMVTKDNSHIPVIVMVQLACGLSTESILIVIREANLTWLVLLVKKKDWSNKKAIKIALYNYKELAA